MGVPAIRPVAMSMLRPEGSPGLTEKERISPPRLVGAASAQGTPITQARVVEAYVKWVGAASSTVIDTEALVEPPELTAVIE